MHFKWYIFKLSHQDLTPISKYYNEHLYKAQTQLPFATSKAWEILITDYRLERPVRTAHIWCSNSVFPLSYHPHPASAFSGGFRLAFPGVHFWSTASFMCRHLKFQFSRPWHVPLLPENAHGHWCQPTFIHSTRQSALVYIPVLMDITLEDVVSQYSVLFLL